MPQQQAAPNYQESMRSILKAQVEMAPEVYAKELEFQPKYQALQDQIAKQAATSQIAMYRDLQPSYSALEEDYMKSQQAAQLRRASTFTGSAAGPHLWHLQTRLPALLLHHHRVPGCSQLVRVRKRSWPAVSQMVSLTRFPPSSTTLALKSTPAGNRAGKERKKTG